MSQNKQVVKDASGDYVTSRIPMDERRSSVNIFSTVAGWVICLSTMLTGGALAAGLNFNDAMIATLIGVTILTIIAAPLSALGGRYGVSTMMLTKPVFGIIGSKLFGLVVVLLNGIGWFAFQAAFFALTMQQLFPNSFFNNLMIGSIVGGFFMTLTALYGYKGIAVLSFAAVPLIVLLSFFGGVAAIEQGGGIARVMQSTATGDSMPLMMGISVVVGNAVVGSIVLSDISRYAKDAKTGAMAASLGYMIGCVFTILCGLAMAYVTSVQGVGTTPNLPAVMVTIGLGVGALLILVLAQWTTNTANLYSASLGMGAFVNISQKYTVAAMGVIATLLAVFNVYAYFIPFLIKVSAFIPPIGGVMIADYYIVQKLRHKAYDFNTEESYYTINWLAIAIVIISAILTQTVLTFFTPAFNSLVVGFVSYAALAIVFDKLKISYRVGEKMVREVAHEN